MYVHEEKMSVNDIRSLRLYLAFENEETGNHGEYVSDIYWTDLTSTLSLSPTPTGEFINIDYTVIGTHIQVAGQRGEKDSPFHRQERIRERKAGMQYVPSGCC
jgi:hypothetical protein